MLEPSYQLHMSTRTAFWVSHGFSSYCFCSVVVLTEGDKKGKPVDEVRGGKKKGDDSSKGSRGADDGERPPSRAKEGKTPPASSSSGSKRKAKKEKEPKTGE